MSLLSREIANWLQTNPGPINGANDTEVFENARATFIAARRWKGDCPMDKFAAYVKACGYRTQTKGIRMQDGSTNGHTSVLPLPAPHNGF